MSRLATLLLATCLLLPNNGVTSLAQESESGPTYSILETKPANKDEVKPQLAVDPAQPESVDAGEAIDRVLTKLVLDSIPHSYEENKDWGKTAERWDGIKWKREGLKVSTKRRKKTVNHGTWKKYSAELIDPNNEFSIEVKNLRKLPNGKTGFDVHFVAHLKLHGRQSKWVKGVQLYSLSADGHAKVRLAVGCELGITLNITQFPPDLVFSPLATSAELEVTEFRIDRISKAGGELAQQFTRAARKSLDRKVREKQSKLVKKINQKLTEQKDDLRLSVSKAVRSRFAAPAMHALPDSIQRALSKPD